VSVEVREPGRAELPAYYRVLPFGNGLPSWEPAPAAWHGGPEAWPPAGGPASPEELELRADRDAVDEDFHPVAALVDGQVVGASAMLSMQVTVPGGSLLRIGGVTDTGVLPTHRRRGLLRRMMQAMFGGALERGESFAMLSASEGGIYGRFGFHPATHRVRWEIDRADACLREAEPDGGSVELVDAATAKAHWPGLHAKVRAGRVGELSPRAGRWDGLSDAARGSDGPLRYLLRRGRDGTVDGLANFTLPWSPMIEHAGTLVVEALEAITPEAYRALWALLLDFDLTRTVVAPGRPRDEPLRWMLANPRAMRITRQSDNLWGRVLDVRSALEGRAYAAHGELSFSVEDDAMCPSNNGAWRLVVDGSGPHCVRADQAGTDMRIDMAALGALYLGGMSASHLAFSGRIRPTAPDAVARLSQMLRTDPEPHNSFGF